MRIEICNRKKQINLMSLRKKVQLQKKRSIANEGIINVMLDVQLKTDQNVLDSFFLQAPLGLSSSYDEDPCDTESAKIENDESKMLVLLFPFSWIIFKVRTKICDCFRFRHYFYICFDSFQFSLIVFLVGTIRFLS